MRRVALRLLLLLIVSALAAPTIAQTQPAAIDWEYARQLIQKQRRGEALTESEQAYLNNARAQRQQIQRPNRMNNANPNPAAPQPKESTGLIPLTQLSSDQKYKDQDGGLYGAGQNVPPPEHLQAALAESRKIVPLDAQGKPAEDGKIVLLSIGMSNTTQEYSRFQELAERDKDKSPNLIVVDGAQGGQDAESWNAGGNPRVWENVDQRLAAAGVTAQQVQVIWVKQALKGPQRLGEFPQHTAALEQHLLGLLHLARQRYPNLRLAYLSSRIYAGYATTALNPEPYAYESAFAVRNLIGRQIKSDPLLNHDPDKGEIKAPLLMWGPYLWADGVKGRQMDDLVWQRDDLREDGTHPSPAGRQKVADLLLKFFKTDPTAQPWFTKSTASATQR